MAIGWVRGDGLWAMGGGKPHAASAFPKENDHAGMTKIQAAEVSFAPLQE